MYESVRMQNFRCFEDLTVDGLTRVNLIVGKNGVGKTTVLESVFLLCGIKFHDPLQALDTYRGLSDPRGRWHPEQSLMEALFHQFDTRHAVEISGAEDSETDQLALAPTSERGRIGAHLEWHLADGRGLTVDYDPDQGIIGGTSSNPDELPKHLPVFIGTTTRPPAGSDAGRFSIVVQEGKRPQVTEALRVVEPRIRSLELLTFGGKIDIHVDLGLARMMPLPLMGEGLQRLCSLVIATAEASEYVLLVDEIDTGLHYSILADMWRVMGAAAREFDYQLFATTHSYECMTAAYEAFADHPEDFSMHRLERINGDIVCKSFGHHLLGNALQMGLEVR